MDKKRIYEIFKNRQICDIYYNDNPIWVQEVQDNIAKIGFLDGSQKDVYIEELYENSLYSDK